jgi:hypothetical protein
MRTWIGFALIACVFSLLQGCDRQPVKPDGTPIAAPNVGVPPPAQLQAATVVSFVKSSVDRLAAVGGACNFDTIAGKSRDDKEISIGSAPLAYDAWAALDTEQSVLGKSVVLQLVGAATYELNAPRTKRADVAAYFKKPGMVDSGFGGKFAAMDVAAGIYELQVLIENSEGKWFKCPVKRSVVVNSGK